MSWPLVMEDMRVRIGLLDTDATRDADIIAAVEIATDLAEAYLDRKITYAADTEEFFCDANRGFLLRRWPVDKTAPITMNGQFIGAPNINIEWIIGGNPANAGGGGVVGGRAGGGIAPGQTTHAYGEYAFVVDAEKGIVYTPRAASGWPVTITYTGGWRTPPSALLWALMAVFDAVWAGTPGFGATAGSSVIAGGEIKRVSLTGIGAVDYSTSTSGSSVGAGNGGAGDPWGVIPAAAVAVLEKFRSQSVIGVG